jgi:MFS family permease
MPSADHATLETSSTWPPGPATGHAESGVAARAAARRRHRHHAFGFWAVALAFVVNLALIAVPTPLYVLYQQRDHFSTIMLTIVYATFSGGVILSLFLGGHLSDWLGRKRVYVSALLLNAATAVVFMAAPSLPGLFVGRIVSGVAIGLATPTATAYLAELHAKRPAGATAPQRPQIVLAAANLGGIAIGPLISGLLAAFAPQPLRLPYLVFLVALVVLTALVALSPETATPPVPRPRYRPQRVAVPPQARRTFFAATATSLAAFAVYGIFNSLAPSFLAVTLHQGSHAVAGAVAFAVFASGAAIQVAMSRAGLRATLRVAPLVLIPGLGLLAAGLWFAILPLFIIGGIAAGAGAALAFRGGLSCAASSAPPKSRAEVLSGFFLGTYIGLSVPAVILGIATQYVSSRSAMLVFSVLVVAAVVPCTRTLRHGDRSNRAGRHSARHAARPAHQRRGGTHNHEYSRVT